MNYCFRRINATDIDSIWSLIGILKAENVDMSFAEIIDKQEILDFVDNPAELTYVAVTEEKPNQILCLLKGALITWEKIVIVNLNCLKIHTK